LGSRGTRGGDAARTGDDDSGDGEAGRNSGGMSWKTGSGITANIPAED